MKTTTTTGRAWTVRHWLLAVLLLAIAASGCGEDNAGWIGPDAGGAGHGGVDVGGGGAGGGAGGGGGAAEPVAGRPDWAGIWGIWGGHNYSFPWLKGTLITVSWDDIEPQDDGYEFTLLDNRIDTALANGQDHFMYLIYIESPPDWVWDKGVPEVSTTWGTYPYYLDPQFQDLVERMWQAVLAHVASFPQEKRERLVAVQVPLGKSGDEQPYGGTVLPQDSQYDIDPYGEEWGAYQRDMVQRFVAARDDAGLDLIPMFKIQQDNYEWMRDEGIAHMRKTIAVAQMYQMNNEMKHDWVREDLFRPAGSDITRARGEFDAPVNWEAGWLAEAPVWHYYWQSLWMLTYGVDMFNQRSQTLDVGDQYEYAFEFFNRRTGYKDPATARYAYVALRDGLDIADTDRFPEAQYGALNGPNSSARYASIVAAMSGPFGPEQGDVANQAVMGLSYSTALDAINDVGYNIWPGNYGLYLEQIDPNETSQGHFRVGSKSEPYGRFARGFRHDQGKDQMFFDVDDRMFEDGAMDGGSVEIRLVYFDQGTGRFALHYDAVSDADQRAFEVVKTDSGSFKEHVVTVADAHFGNRGPRSCDISLVNTDAEDDIFHMVEVTFLDRSR